MVFPALGEGPYVVHDDTVNDMAVLTPRMRSKDGLSLCLPGVPVWAATLVAFCLVL